ncbi:tetratricopeptide repeat protein [Yinghuangia soli]|uniref:Tetratricopeptide repeat protein n=1 Tax=Yinghuangia soli TaxID=2908204 RepID=A0AA41U340_9ACTN|nr:hypothetical protein [Yinghuangia soli]MCF2531405.1 hypothetical protein [Yinghuangia soli]
MAGLFDGFMRLGDDPAGHDAALDRADKSREKNQLDRARRLYERIVATADRLGVPEPLRESRRRALAALGEIACQEARPAEAAACAHELAQDPEGLAPAVAVLAAAAALDPQLAAPLAEFRHRLGRYRFAHQRYAEAADVLSAMPARTTPQTELLGRSLARIGHLERAAAVLEQDPGAAATLGHVLVRAGRLHDAAAAYDRAEQTPEVLLHRGDVLRRIGFPDRAFRDLEQAGASAPASYAQGRLALGEQDYESARLHFMAALVRDPGLEQARYGLGMAYEFEGEHAKAYAEYRTIAGAWPGLPERLAATATAAGEPDARRRIEALGDPYLVGLGLARSGHGQDALDRWAEMTALPPAAGVGGAAGRPTRGPGRSAPASLPGDRAATHDALARDALAGGDTGEARRHWRLAAALLPQEACFREALGETYVRELAAEDVTGERLGVLVHEAKQFLPEDPRVHRHAARAVLLGGDREAIAAELRTRFEGPLAGDLDPRTQRWRAAAYLASGRTDQAVYFFEAAGAPQPYTDVARLRQSVQEGDHDRAGSLCAGLLADSGAAGRYAAAVAALLAADVRNLAPDEAAEGLHRAALLGDGQPYLPLVRAEQARLAMVQGDDATALAALQALDALKARAGLGTKGGPPVPAAVAAALESITAPPGLRAVLLQRAAGRASREGRHAEALALIQEALRTAPRFNVIWSAAVVADRCARSGRAFPGIWPLLGGTWVALLHSDAFWRYLGQRTGRSADEERTERARAFHVERLTQLVRERGHEDPEAARFAATLRLELAVAARIRQLPAALEPNAKVIVNGPLLADALDALGADGEGIRDGLAGPARHDEELRRLLSPEGRYELLLAEGDHERIIAELTPSAVTAGNRVFLVRALTFKGVDLHARRSWAACLDHFEAMDKRIGQVGGQEDKVADAATELARSILADHDDYDAAVAVLRRGRKLVPGDERITEDLAATFNRWAASKSAEGDTRKAHQLITTALDYAPDAPLIRRNYVVSTDNYVAKMVEDGNLRKACTVVEEARKRVDDPVLTQRLGVLRHNLGVQLTNQRRFADGISEFEQALALDPDPVVRQMMAQCYGLWASDAFEQRHITAALERIHKAIRLDPDNVTWYRLKMLIEQGRLGL